MILTMERVLSPGWITRTFEDELTGAWACYHECVDCGKIIDGEELRSGRNLLLEHAKEKHEAKSFALELYFFRSAIHALHPYSGLEAFEWPDKARP